MRVLFVCLGTAAKGIACRSPTAEGVLRHKLAAGLHARIGVDLAGPRDAELTELKGRL